MRKLYFSHTQTDLSSFVKSFRLHFTLVFLLGMFSFGIHSLNAQCAPVPGKIGGTIFDDRNYNGIREAQESGIAFVQLNAFDAENKLVASALTDLAGNYTLNGLIDGIPYAVEIVKPVYYEFTRMGLDHVGDLRIVKSPVCNAHFGFYKPKELNFDPNPQIAVSSFVGGVDLGINAKARTIIGLDQNFNSISTTQTLAEKNQTGAVYGLAYNTTHKKLYASSFIKYGAVQGPLGTGGIYVIDRKNGSLSPFINLSDVGISTGSTGSTGVTDCAYGDLVGKLGLGNMDISSDDRFLFVTNLYNKSVVIIPTENPSAANVIEIRIPDPGCHAGDYAVSAIKYYNGSLYVGVTCTAESSKNPDDCTFHVYELNLLSRVFNLILSSDFIRDYWPSQQGDLKTVSHWLTDLDFNRFGEMILGVTDRKGHAFCLDLERLTNQRGDILMAYKTASTWVLESAGYVNGRAGSGLTHLEGPGRGEFFGEDYWIVGPSLHQEISTGTLAAMTQKDEVINVVFDPLYESFTGGLQRYSTIDGKKTGAIQLYGPEGSFGKASGLGDVELMNESTPVEIGNILWLDKNSNGIQDANEKGIAGVRITLFDAQCKKVASVLTASDGSYLFDWTNVDLNGDGTPDGLKYGESYFIVLDDPRYFAFNNRIIVGKDTLTLSYKDKTTGGQVDVRDNDAAIGTREFCSQFEGLPVIKVVIGNNGQNVFNVDIGLMPSTDSPETPPDDFVIDLALIKKVKSLGQLRKGDLVEFELEIHNQGTVPVQGYTLVDYIPAGMYFQEIHNPGWKLLGDLAEFKLNQAIQPGEIHRELVRLNLDDANQIGAIVNVAEIAEMRDENGQLLSDFDSTPDRVKTNDRGGQVNSPTDNTITNPEDEDDHDAEALLVNDLALIKTLRSALPVKKDELVVFDIHIKNQGNNSIAAFEITDYVPAGFEFISANNPGWILNNGKAIYQYSNGIAAGESKFIAISLKVRNNATAASLINVAEISKITDGAGNLLMDRDSKADSDPANDAGGQLGGAYDNFFNGDGIDDEDDHDAAQPAIADLALVKQAELNTAVKMGQLVSYKISVRNQGAMNIGSYSIVDYIPTGLEFVPSENPGWIYNNGLAKFTDPLALSAGSTRELKIKLKVISSNPADLINEAEIYQFTNVAGDILKDWDSNPDLISGNDDFVELTASQKLDFAEVNGDEDDSDSESLNVLDLALILTTSKNTPVKPNEDVTYQIRICNQGNVIAGSVEFVNYIPTGLSLSPIDNNGWILKGGLLYNSIQQTILPGACATKEIVLRVKPTATINNILNRAEITTVLDGSKNNVSAYDLDSNPDTNPSNDPGGVAGTTTDNILTGNGVNDEDDADPENLMLMDVALTKRTTTTTTLKYKGNVSFEIRVTNQGNQVVRNVQISDYIPAGFAVTASSISAGWSVNGNIAKYTISQLINPGASVNIPISMVDLGTAGDMSSISNKAEVFKIHNNQNLNWSAYDFDSTPDEDSANDPIDEDDHDASTISVFDLALSKVIPNKSLFYRSGDDVKFRITVMNQGSVSSSKTEIVDYLDSRFEYIASANPGWTLDGNGILHYTINDIIPAAGSKSVDLVLRIKSGNEGVMIPNFSEIYKALDARGVALIDYDSKPDLIPDNDLFVENSDHKDHGETDEDDHDGTDTNPNNFDLALEKSVGVRVVKPGDLVDWYITITNQGSTAASEIVIVDEIPEGTALVSNGDWYALPNQSGNNKFYYTFSEKNGRLPLGGLKNGESVQAVIQLKIDTDRESGQLINRAEIYSAKNAFTMEDQDSHPDNNLENDGLKDYMAFDDIGGTDPETGEVPVVEDDADLAGVYLLEIDHLGCICLNNATTSTDGQFRSRLEFESRSGEIWFIRSVNGLYLLPSPAPPAAPTPFTTGPAGYLLSPVKINGPVTIYAMEGTHIDDIGFDIVLENQFGDKVSLGNVRCRYDAPILREAQNNVCSGATVRYSVDYRPGHSYQWTLSSGGDITSGTNSHAVAVQWNGATNSKHILKVKEFASNECLEPLELEVTIGSYDGPVSCIGDLQVSLGVNCEARVTPQMLLVGGPYDYNAYTVMLMNKDGSLIPNATVNYSHVGKTLQAKLINVCNGNKCWATITVEDKWKPEIICLNDTIDCTRMKSHLGPLVYDYCDLNPTKILIDERIEDTRCNPLYSKIVTRNWQAKDASGNLSNICTAQYFLKRINFDSIVFPDSLTVAKYNPLLCGKYQQDSLGRPSPSVTGIPLYHGSPLWPNNDTKYCDYSASFEDFVIPSGKNCVRKIMRVWKFVIWYCDRFQQITYNQLIEIVDDEAPEMTCPYDIQAITGSASCEAQVFIPMPKVSDNCSSIEDIRIDLVYPGGIIKNYTARYVTLPAGGHILKFRAYDLCYNVDSCEFRVLVEDLTPPTVQCDRETVVTLDRFGKAYVPAEVFDDGTYDNCLIKDFKVQRMDNGGPCGFQINYPTDSIEFCCSDLEQFVTVLFVATDHHGNSNTCMVRVEVQDKTIPFVYCPHDVTIDCHDHIDRNDLSSFGSARVSDNCDVTLTEVDSFHIDQCREGYIDRIFIAGNSFGKSVCVQKIFIINNEPFDAESITWPADFDTTSCAFDALNPATLPAGYGYPILNEDACDLVGIKYEDHPFRILNGTDACYKILRKWKVTNWCRFYDKGGNPIIYDRTQIIKVYNNVAPSFEGDCQDRVFETRDTNCLNGHAELIIRGNDDCTPSDELRNEYHIDLYKDGIIDHHDINVGGEINASGTYPLGKHSIRYVFEDLCGNKSVCEADFEILNKKAPVAYCLKGIAVGLNPWDLNGDGKVDGEFAEVWAKDLDRGSYHPCGYDLTYSIGRDTSIKSIRYDCDSIGIRIVELCVTASNGEQSCCETFVEVQDNNKVDFCNCLQKPANITVSDCEQRTSPVDLGSFPTLGNCTCDKVEVSHSDRIVSGPVNTCFVIERTWTAKFDCPGNDNEFTFVQRITVTTNLKRTDITWPKDTVVVDNCLGSTDTAIIGETPLVCSYKGQVMMMYSDRVLSQNGNERVIERIWTVFSKCVTDGSQTFTFRQILRVINSTGVRYNVPSDITITDCKASILPPDLNGFPRVNCPCDKVNHSYRDSIAAGGGTNVCYTIFRRWTSTYNCPPDVVGTYTGTQRIFVSIDLKLSDIMWGRDSILVNDCSGKIDTGKIGGVPKLLKDFCGYVTISFVDTVKSNVDTCKIVQRTWTVNNTCRTGPQSQTFRRNQIIKILFPNGPRLKVPADITVTDCAKPLLPDSLNGYPRVECGCDSLMISFRNDTMRNNPEVCFTINRTWTVRVRCRPLVDTVLTGVQRITLDVDLNPADIIWPRDSFTSFTCVPTLDPNITGRPSLRRNYCGLVRFNFVDTVRAGNPCRFIERTWRATNDCSASQVFRFKQILITKNQTPPSITCPADRTVNSAPNTCGAVVNLGNPTLNNDCNTGVTFQNNAPAVFPVGKTNVVFTATDSCGNSATCITMVTVIENVPPEITCPANDTVGCDVNTDDLSIFGNAMATDNCPGVTVRDTAMRNQNACGIGTITRIFTATDASGNTRSCTQTIRIENSNPLDAGDINWPQSPITVDECAPIDTADTGFPSIDTNAVTCFKLRITWQDSNLCKVRGACEIERYWQIYDTCSDRTFNFTQLIIRDDQNPPVINVPFMDTTLYATPTDCNNFVSLIASVSGCDSALVEITNNSPYGANDMEDASGFYPLGTTTVTFRAEDPCCNIATKEVKITVIDTVAPEVTCKKVIKNINDTSLCRTFNPREFIVMIDDNCTDSANIMASFDINNFMDTVETICCDTLGADRDYLGPITVYFKDEAGNIDSCVTLLQVTDTDSLCPITLRDATVQGIISGRGTNKLKGIDVLLNDGANGTQQSGIAGLYAFRNMPLGGAYEVKPFYDKDHRDGVSTLDLILIQKHILGTRTFENPYQWIAADVNKTNTITAADISELRKLILGISERFSKNTSWRFVYDDYKWLEPDFPLFEKFMESYKITNLNRTHTINYTGVKIGDIDDSNQLSRYQSNALSRTQTAISLRTEDKYLLKSEVYTFEVSLKDWSALDGIQTALTINPDVASLMDVSGVDGSVLGSDNWNAGDYSEGLVKFVWVNDESSAGEWKVKFTIRSNKNQYLSDVLYINNRALNSEAYHRNGLISDIQLEFQNSNKPTGLNSVRLYQNIPNPFKQSTRIPFEISKDGEIIFEVMDVNGKLLYQRKSQFPAGYHEIELSKSIISKPGVYYYQIQTGTEKYMKRMVMID